MSTRGRRASASSIVLRRSAVCGGSVMFRRSAPAAARSRRSTSRSAPSSSSCRRRRRSSQHGVVRRVVGLEERRHVVHRRRVEVLHRADDGVLVRRVVVGLLAEHFATSCRTAGCRGAAGALPGRRLRWLSRFALLMSSDFMRSASRKSASSSWLAGTRLVIQRSVLVGGSVHGAAVGEDRACGCSPARRSRIP